MNKRINVVLSEATVQSIDRIARPGQRSKFIEQAVHHFVSHRSSEAVRIRLEQTTVRDRDIDREVASDWVAVDNEAWKHLDTKKQVKLSTRSAAKSTSRPSTRR